MTKTHQVKTRTNFIEPTFFTNKEDLVGKLGIVVRQVWSERIDNLDNGEVRLRPEEDVCLVKVGEIVLFKKLFSIEELRQPLDVLNHTSSFSPPCYYTPGGFDNPKLCLVLSSTGKFLVHDRDLRIVLGKGCLKGRRVFMSGSFRYQKEILKKLIELEGGEVKSKIEESNCLLLGRPSRKVKKQDKVFDDNNGLPLHPTVVVRKQAREIGIEIINERQFYNML